MADLDRDALGRRGDQLLRGHLEAAVAVDRPHGAIGPADLGADGRGHREPHRAEAAGVHPGVRLREAPVLRRPHLVLADAGHEDRALGGAVAQRLQAELGLERLARLGLLVRVAGTAPASPRCGSATPTCRPARRRRRAPSRNRLHDLLDHQPAVAHDRHVGPADLALLGRIDVDVDDLGLGRERGDLARHAVVEAGAERDQQVGLLQRRHRGGVAVHAGHAEAQRVVVREGAAGHERGDDVDLGQLGQLAQRVGGPGLQDAAADVEHRPLGGQDQAGRLADHAGVALDVRPVAGQRVGHGDIAGPVPLHRLLEHVLGDVDQHRARAAGRGDVEGLADGQRQVLGGHHQLVVLRDRAGDADGVALLEGVGADRGRRDLPGDARPSGSSPCRRRTAASRGWWRRGRSSPWPRRDGR